MLNTLYSHITNHNHTHMHDKMSCTSKIVLDSCSDSKNIDWTQLQHEWSQQKRGRRAAMHPIKVLNQVIAKVLKLNYSSSQFFHLPSWKISLFFSPMTPKSLCFCMVSRLEEGVEENRGNEQRGEKNPKILGAIYLQREDVGCVRHRKRKYLQTVRLSSP